MPIYPLVRTGHINSHIVSSASHLLTTNDWKRHPGVPRGMPTLSGISGWPHLTEELPMHCLIGVKVKRHWARAHLGAWRQLRSTERAPIIMQWQTCCHSSPIPHTLSGCMLLLRHFFSLIIWPFECTWGSERESEREARCVDGRAAVESRRKLNWIQRERK